MLTKTFFNFDRNLVCKQGVKTAFGRLCSSMYTLYVLHLREEEKNAGCSPATIEDVELFDSLSQLITGGIKKAKRDLISLNQASKSVGGNEVIGFLGSNAAVYGTLADAAHFAGKEFSDMEELFREKAEEAEIKGE